MWVERNAGGKRMVGTGRFELPERGCAAPLAGLFFAPPLRCGHRFWGARDRLSRDQRGLKGNDGGKRMVGTGRFEGAERGCAAPLAGLFFAPPLRYGDRFWGARDRQSRDQCGLKGMLVGNEWSGRADLNCPNAAARLPSQGFSLRLRCAAATDFGVLVIGCRETNAG